MVRLGEHNELIKSGHGINSGLPGLFLRPSFVSQLGQKPLVLLT
jgi:hypothetical protein